MRGGLGVSSGIRKVTHVRVRGEVSLVRIVVCVKFPGLLVRREAHGVRRLRFGMRGRLGYMGQGLGVTVAGVMGPCDRPGVLTRFVTKRLGGEISFHGTVGGTVRLARRTNAGKVRMRVTKHVSKGRVTHIR